MFAYLCNYYLRECFTCENKEDDDDDDDDGDDSYMQLKRARTGEKVLNNFIRHKR